MNNTSNPEKTSKTKPKRLSSAFKKVSNRDFRLNYCILRSNECLIHPANRINIPNINLSFLPPFPPSLLSSPLIPPPLLPPPVINVKKGSVLIVDNHPIGKLYYMVLPTGLIMPIVPTVPPIIKPNQLRRGNSM
jgi:hypothetical protein